MLLLLAIPTKNGAINHTASFTGFAKTKEAHAETLTAIKALALTGFRVLDDDVWFSKVSDGLLGMLIYAQCACL
jgi:hypothetical protein